MTGEILYWVVVIIGFSNVVVSYPYENDATWEKVSCSRKILGIVQMPINEYFSGSIVEIIDGNFGPAVYFRSNMNCSSYFFAVPLPFSIHSMTYVNGQFFVIRDDVDDGTSTLYTIKDFDLIGGYLFWLQQSDLQCRLCSSSQLPPTFDLNNQQPSCAIASGVTSNICPIDLDILFAKERVSLSLDIVRENGYRMYRSFLRKFELLHAYPTNVTLLEKAWLWTKWNMYASFPHRFTSVHKLELLDYLLVNQPNFKYMQIMDHLSPPVALTVKPDTSRYITMTSFEYGGIVTLVGIDFNGILHIIDYTSGRRIKIGSLPYSFRQLFVINSYVLVGLDASNNAFSSSDYITDVLLPHNLCREHTIPSSGGCSFNINLPVPFTPHNARDACMLHDAIYKERESISASPLYSHIMDNVWISHSNGHQFYISSNKLPFFDAGNYCNQFSTDVYTAHLAIVNSDEIFDTLMPKLNELPLPDSSSIWLGGYLNSFDDWMWNDGSQVMFDRDETSSGSNLCLSMVYFESGNVTLNSLSCSTQTYFICESYQVCWDFFPKTVLNLNEFVNTTDGENLPYVFNFGKIDISSENPVQECAHLCQQNIGRGCVAFTYTEDGFGNWSRSCFGRNKYHLYDNSTTPSIYHVSGFLQQCNALSLIATTIKYDLPIPVNCTKTAANETSEVLSVFCPPGCLSVDADVFGTGYYAEDSSICRAAIHDAQISDFGGSVKVYRKTGSIDFSASVQNGITSFQHLGGQYAFAFDPNIEIPYDHCSKQYKMLKKCASISSAAACGTRDCCVSTDIGYDACFSPLPSGPKFSGDRWLKSPYSSYQYAVIYTEERTDMPGARQKCQAEGGELAYAGLLDELSYRYIFDNVIYQEHSDSYMWNMDSIWIGIIDKHLNNTFVGLNGKSGDFYDWSRTEPNHIEGEGCVMVWKFDTQQWADISCSGLFSFHNALCQRISSRCDIALESRMPCNENVPFNASKLECISNGCCYIEPLDGNDICFKGNQEESTADYWWASPFNEYEYTVIEVPPGWEEGRLACMDRGGDLAYAGMTELSTYQVIYDNYISLFTRYVTIWFGLHDLVQEGVYVDLEGRVSNLSYYASNEPTGGTSSNCLRIGSATGLWLDSGCKMDVPAAICQRFRDKTRKEYWWSSSSDDYEYRVLEVSSTWNDARLACMNIGGDLASAGIGEASTCQTIYENIASFYFHHPFIWIGVNDRAEENTFVDLYGRRINMNNFGHNEPNGNTHENCVSMWRDSTYWTDNPCSSLINAALCQRTKEKVSVEYWWRSPFSGYEYTVIEAPSGISWDDARLTCIDKGGDLAYSGMTDGSAYYAIYDNYLSLFSHVGSLWIGINDQEEGTFVGLDGKGMNWTNFIDNEPNGGTTENCVAFHPSGKWNDLACYRDTSGVVCQRSKDENLGDKWWKAPFNNYEYTVIQSSLPGFDQARQDCKRKGLGADLGYAGLTESSTHELIFDKVISLYPDYRHMWIGINYLSGGNFVDLNGTVASWTNFENNMNGGSSCVQILSDSGNWIDTACSNDVDAVLCQRLADASQIEKENIVCETQRDEMCMKYSDQCHENASCVDHMTWFECVCNEGFVGDGEACTLAYKCPDGWVGESTGCYFVKISTVSFYEAEQECQSMDAHLISIHSDEEYQLLRDLVLTSPMLALRRPFNPTMFWIGLRRNIKLVSRNGEEYPGCGLWTDGTHCVYNQTNSGIRNHECFLYSTSEELWQENVCALRVHYASRQEITGFVCKQEAIRPLYLNVKMTSLSWDIYPGFAHMTVNGRAMAWKQDNVTVHEIGCIHITSLTEEGLVVNSHSVCNANEDDAKSELSVIASTILKDPKERYIAIATGGKVNPVVWRHFYYRLREIGLSIHLQYNVEQENTQEIDSEDFVETELSANEAIYKCAGCNGVCSGVGIFHNENGDVTCRAFFPDGVSPSQYQYAVTTLSWDQNKQDKKQVVFRSKTLKASVVGTELSCPWLTEEVKGFGVNLLDIVDDDDTKTSIASCFDPPCVQQIACKRPARLSESDVNHDVDGQSFLMFCKKSQANEFYCPIKTKGFYFEGPLHADVQMPVTKAPMLATFDDLLFLGSPPFEYGSIYGPHNITWRPVQWTWTNDQYALIVTGIKNRAIRFQNEEVHSPNDICWWNLGDSSVCPHGLTVSFWFKIVSWPTSEDQVIIDTGAWGSLGNCQGVVVYISASSHDLIVLVKSSDQIWLKSQTVQLQKWTHIWFAWSPSDQTLKTVFDWWITGSISAAYSGIYLNPYVGNCETSTFSVGSTTPGNCIFDLDDLQVFTVAMANTELLHWFSEWTLPIRHHFVTEVATITYQDSQTLIGGSQCIDSPTYRSCGRFGKKCLGTVAYCQRGFSLAFSLRFPNISGQSYTHSSQHVMLISNLPHETQTSDYARTEVSYGFRIFTRKTSKKRNSSLLWKVAFQHTLASDPIYQPELSWLVDPLIKVPFWLQYHRDGVWLFCYRWPTNCKKQNSFTINDVHAFRNNETYTEFSIGPTKVIKQSNNYVTESLSIFEITNVWFIEEAYDIVMFADEVNMISNPVHWQAIPITYNEGNYISDQGYQFEGGELEERIRWETKTSFGRGRVSLRNSLSKLQTYLDAGFTLKQAAAWLELSADALLSLPCLYDIDNCINGFTLQFWLKAYNCKVSVSGGDCYFVSTGGQATPLSRGIAFYRSYQNENYYVIIATSHKVWNMSFIADLKSYYNLIRISWHNDIGLSLFLNDVPVIRLTKWQPVVHPTLDDEAFHDYLSFDPFRAMTIGRRNDRFEGFMYLDFGDMYFWDGLVEGMPYQSIGGRCPSNWLQIGENCFFKSSSIETHNNAKQICGDMGADLAYLPSLPVSEALNRYVSGNDSVVKYWIDVEEFTNQQAPMWTSLQLPISTTNFHAFANVLAYDTTSNFSVVAKKLTGFFEQDVWYWDFADSSTASVLCAAPLTRDPFLHGCYIANTELSSLGFDSSASFPLHHILSTDVSTKSLNSFGSHDIPQSCRRLCYTEYGSSVSLVAAYDCYCLDRDVSLSDISSIGSTLPSVYSCTATNVLTGINNLDYGYNVLNYKPGTFRFHYPPAHLYCGPIENGGLYKCGAEVESDLHAAVYAFSGILLNDTTLLPLSSISVSIANEVTVESFETLSIEITNIECCLNDDQVDGKTECECAESLISIHIDFGDSSTYEIYLMPSDAVGFEMLHFYENTENYTLIIKAQNFIGSAAVQFESQINVLVHIEKPELNYIWLDVVTPGQLAEVITEGLLGTHMQCSWIYGDGSPTETVYVEQLPIPKVYHRYQDSGQYDVTVSCINRLQTSAVSTVAVVHERISGLQAVSDVVVEFGESYIHEWHLFRGTYIDCNVYFGTYSLSESDETPNSTDTVGSFYFNQDTNQGIALIPNTLYITMQGQSEDCIPHGAATTYALLVTCFNAVTDPSPYVITYVTFEVPINDFTAHIMNTASFLTLDESVCVEVNIGYGSNVVLRLDWGDVKNLDENIIEYCGQDECNQRIACITYGMARDYIVTIDAMNSIGIETVEINVYVEIPVREVLLQFVPALVPYQESEINMLQDPPFPDGLVQLDFGDGSNIITMQMNFSTQTNTMRVLHRYYAIGYYNVTVYGYNNVSSFTASSLIQIGLLIEDIQLSLVTSRFVRCHLDTVIFTLQVEAGSELVYNIDFGDGSNQPQFNENEVRRGPHYPDVHTLHHIYEQPGNYVVSIEVENVFGKSEATFHQQLIAQNPLHGGIFTLAASLTKPVPYPPGLATFKAYLSRNESFYFQSPENIPDRGWANDVHIRWIHSTPSGNVELEQNHGTYDLDLFPKRFLFTHEDVGTVTVFALVENLVSNLVLLYKFQVMEVIEGLQVEVSNLENPEKNVINDLKFEVVHVTIRHELTFVTRVVKGSHVSFKIDYGDGNVDLKSSPVLFASDFPVAFTHAYGSVGTYTINATAFNEVGEMSEYFEASVFVYETVETILSRTETVDIDEEISGIDLFTEFSELYVVAYNKPGITSKNGLVYFPFNYAISWHVGSLDGSNASIEWNFINSNVTVHVSPDGMNDVLVSDSTTDSAITLRERIAQTDNIKLKVLEKLTSSQVEILGEHLRSKLDMTNYRAESTLLTRFLKPGQQHVKITVSNPVSSESILKVINVEAVVDGISFAAFEPPIANRTSNITFSVNQVGTNSCFVLDPGDLSLEIAFGLSVDYCVGLQGINSDNFYLLTEDHALYTGQNFSHYNFSGDLSNGVAQFELTLHHIYALPLIYRAKLSGFNRVSRVETSVDLAVTEILCDYPTVNVEKHEQNSIQFPRRILSFLEFRLYASIRTNCKLTSKTVITWQAYAMKELAIQMLFSDEVSTENNDDSQFVDLPLSAQAFSSPYYRFKIIPGLSYTSKSEDITIKPRFLNLGLHLICINVAMYGVDGIVTTDCIYIIVVLPPLVAGMTYGVRRAVGYDQLIDMNAAAASYDPDQQTLAEVENLMGESNPGNLVFMFSCPFLVEGDTSGEADIDELSLMFFGKTSWKNTSFCGNLTIECDNSYHVIDVLSARFLNFTNLFFNASNQFFNASNQLFNASNQFFNASNQFFNASNQFFNASNQFFNFSNPIFNPNLSNVTANVSSEIDLVTDLLKRTCVGNTSCNIMVTKLLAIHLAALGINHTINESNSYCMEIVHRCDVKKNSSLFDYTTSTTTCIPSGYYPKIEGQSSEACHAVTAKDYAECGKIEVNTGLLQSGSSYMVRIRVVHPPTGRKAVGSQVIQIDLGEPPKLRIDCQVNCNIKTNARTAISVGVTRTNDLGEVISHNGTAPISYTWSLLEVVNRARTRRDLSENLDLVPVPEFEINTATGVHGIYLIINPGFLLPVTKYRVRVVGEIEGATPGLTEMELIPNLPPYNGNCYVTPAEGIAVNDTFTVICQDWKDEGINVGRSEFISPNEYTLGYQIYYQASRNIPFSLLSYGSESTVSGLLFPPGHPENDNRVWVQVRIIDEYGAQALVNLTVQVYEASDLSNAMLENLTRTQILSAGSQNIAQISASVAGILNVQNNTSIDNNSSAAQLSVQVKQKSLLRSHLLDAVVEKINTNSDLDGIQQSCSTISSITAVPAEVSDSTQITAIDALSERTNLLSKLAETRASEDVADTASVMVIGLENVVQSARTQVLASLGTTDSHSSLVSLPVFSPPAPVAQSSKLTVDEEELYLSPEEREERRTEQFTQKSSLHIKNNEQAMKVGTRAASSISSISGSLLKQKLPGEPAVSLRANGLKLDAQRNDPAELCRLLSLNKTTNTTSASPSALASILLSSNVQLGDCNKTDSEKSIDTELMELDDNPFIWDDSADYVRSSIVSLSFKFPNGSKPFQGDNNTFRLELPVKSSLSNVPPEEFNFIPSGVDRMSFHELNARQLDDVIFLTIQPISSNHTDMGDSEHIRIRVYFLYTPNLQIFPTIDNFTFVHELPDYTSDFPYRIRLDNFELPSLGRYVYGILQLNDFGNITSESNMTLHNYTINNMVTSCRFWNETTQRWETSGCRVGDETSSKIVVCLCNHLTSFGADFLVAPNPIDFSALASKLANLKDNLAVLLTIIGLLVVYVISLIACRRFDKKDVSKWSVALLMDNNLCDTYFYQITVKTGSRRDGSTSSKIFFHVSGDEGTTSLRILADDANTKFINGSVRKFLMAVNEPLGVLSFIKIWHDNSGKDSMASWYLDHIIISDLQTKQRYYFFCNDWLAVDQSDGCIQRILPVASDQQISSFKHLFSSSTRKDFNDGHLWFSLFSRPTKSHFTRVQRLTCAVTVLFSTMLASTMFYGKDEEDEGKQGVLEIGPIKLTVQQLLISIEASLVVIPINVLLVQLFRRSRAKEDNATADDDNRLIISKSVESIEKQIEEEHSEQGKGKKFSFPYWAVYIAWVLAAVITLVSATFVFLYSVEWGAEKAQDWLLSIVFSFVQSVFVIQPAKVILLAIALSLFVNRCAKERADQMLAGVEENKRKEDVDVFKQKEEEWLLQSPLDDELEAMRHRKTDVSNSELNEARKKRFQHKVMMDTIHDVIAYILYVVLLLIAANSAKDPQAYRFHRSLSDVFLLEGEPPFEEIRTPTDFWDWCDNALIPGLHASSWYNGDRITWLQSRFISNRETFVAGPARIRQLRVKHGPCKLPDDHSLVTRECVSSYNIWNQETSEFTSGWKNPTNFTTITSPWTFQNFFDLGGFPYNGLMDLYDGGGYAVTLGNTARSSRKKLEILKDENWIDRHTAAVFIEFTVYNANVNLFGSFVLLLERSQNGAFFAYPTISPIRLYDFVDGKGYLLIVVYVIFVVIFIYNMICMGKKIKVEKKKYFKDFWHVLDLISACLTVTAIALYALRHIHANNTLEKITVDVDKETFVNFQYIVLWHDTFRFLVAFTLFLATVKFSKLLHFNRRIRLLALTLRHATVPVLYFSAMFGIYFIAFMFLANIWFEQKMYAYSSLYLTAEELFSMLLGRFDFTELKAADQLLGPFFFTAFTGVLTIALLNMFICILDESIKKARAEVENEKNQFEVVDYMMKQISNYFYTNAPKFLATKICDTEEEDGPVYIDYPEEVLELRVDALRKYVNKMESEFYASVTLEELEAELEEESDDYE